MNNIERLASNPELLAAAKQDLATAENKINAFEQSGDWEDDSALARYATDYTRAQVIRAVVFDAEEKLAAQARE